jgi:RNA polymerase-binding transcription factor DksA
MAKAEPKPVKASAKKAPAKQAAKQLASRSAKRAPAKAPSAKKTAKPEAVKPRAVKPEAAKKIARPAKKLQPPKKVAKPADVKKVASVTKARPAPKKAAKPAVVKKAEPPKKAPPRKSTVVCPLSGFEVKPDKPNLAPSTVERLRVKLLDERERHLAQADQLAAEAQQLALDRDEGDTQFDEEGGEGDTISVERERDLMLSASARQIVEEIDRALERIKNRTYGLCVPAGRRISVERLEALPYAETCVDCKARAERRR